MRRHDVDPTPRSFFTTPHVTIGRGAITALGGIVRDLGIQSGNLLLVTDRTLLRLGMAARVQELLRSAGYDVTLFSDIHGEPTEETAKAITHASRHAGPVAVVGVGGGSALDMGKLAAVMATNPGTEDDYFSGRTFEAPPVPLVLIPTTAGTGSESSRNAVVSRRGQKVFVSSQFLVPRAAILDPELTLALPSHITAWTGMDALSHCVEALLSINGSPLTDAVATRGIQLVHEHLPVAYANGSDIQARSQMLVGAHLGGLAINAGMVLGHSMANTLSNRLHLAHGLSCALALPACVAYSAAAAPERRRLVAQALGVVDEPRGVVEAIRYLASTVGIPQAWREVGLAREDLAALVEECITRYPRPNNPRPLEREPLYRLYDAAWAGDPLV